MASASSPVVKPKLAPARALALRRHLGVPRRGGFVGDTPALVLEDLLREIARESVRVVELEQETAVDGQGGRNFGTRRRRNVVPTVRFDILVDSGEARLERLCEPLFLVANGVLDARLHRNE